MALFYKDTLINILKNLDPRKDLGTAALICKRWFQIITCPDFKRISYNYHHIVNLSMRSYKNGFLLAINGMNNAKKRNDVVALNSFYDANQKMWAKVIYNSSVVDGKENAWLKLFKDLYQLMGKITEQSLIHESIVSQHLACNIRTFNKIKNPKDVTTFGIAFLNYLKARSDLLIKYINGLNIYKCEDCLFVNKICHISRDYFMTLTSEQQKTIIETCFSLKDVIGNVILYKHISKYILDNPQLYYVDNCRATCINFLLNLNIDYKLTTECCLNCTRIKDNKMPDKIRELFDNLVEKEDFAAIREMSNLPTSWQKNFTLTEVLLMQPTTVNYIDSIYYDEDFFWFLYQDKFSYDLAKVCHVFDRINPNNFDQEIWLQTFKFISEIYVDTVNVYNDVTIDAFLSAYRGTKYNAKDVIALNLSNLTVCACKNTPLLFTKNDVSELIEDYIRYKRKRTASQRNILNNINAMKYLEDTGYKSHLTFIRKYICEVITARAGQKIKLYYQILCLYLMLCKVNDIDHYNNKEWSAIKTCIDNNEFYKKASHMILHQLGY